MGCHITPCGGISSFSGLRNHRRPRSSLLYLPVRLCPFSFRKPFFIPSFLSFLRFALTLLSGSSFVCASRVRPFQTSVLRIMAVGEAQRKHKSRLDHQPMVGCAGVGGCEGGGAANRSFYGTQTPPNPTQTANASASVPFSERTVSNDLLLPTILSFGSFGSLFFFCCFCVLSHIPRQPQKAQKPWPVGGAVRTPATAAHSTSSSPWLHAILFISSFRFFWFVLGCWVRPVCVWLPF